MSKLRCAVIGVGYLGKFHAEKYTKLDNVELVAVCDSDPDICAEIANQFGVQGVTNYKELLGKVDAVSIVVPTFLHHEIGKAFLEAGAHVLMEKPITKTLDEAHELIAIAKRNKLTLQVGHLERFNAARQAIDEFIDNPQFIESNRIAPFKLRGTDVNVILELMIHDIDIIQTIVKSPITSIDAQGAPILSEFIDIANARINFENGCVANVTASRISFKSQRKMRIFQPNSYISLDFQDSQFAVFEKGAGEMFPGVPDIKRVERKFEKTDALMLEIKSFIDCIQQQKTPVVTGEDGARALEVAIHMTKMIRKRIAHLQKHAQQQSA